MPERGAAGVTAGVVTGHPQVVCAAEVLGDRAVGDVDLAILRA